MARMIEEATERDIPALVALWEGAGLTRPWNDPAADARRALGGPSSTILVARQGARLLGSAMVGWDGHRGWAYYLASLRPGTGRALMDAAQGWLRARFDAPKMQCLLRADNAAARGFYEALGYRNNNTVCMGRWLDNREDM